MTEYDDKEPLAKAYDDTDGEHIANLYTPEAVRGWKTHGGFVLRGATND